MDRSIEYTQEQIRSTDFLFAQRATMIGLSKLAKAMFGAGTVVEGLPVSSNSPAALNVLVGTGQIYSIQSVDSSAYGILAADTTHTILKQGLLMDAATIATAAPTTAGYSINYLIQSTLSETDTNPLVLPYFNSANPSQPLSGQNNSGATQATQRQDLCIVSALPGAAATTGTQTTPAPSVGYVGLAVVTVAYGQTTVTAANISVYSAVPQITSILQMMQSSSSIYAADTGTANAYSIALTPAPSLLSDGMIVTFKALNANTGASTLNVNGIGAKALVNQDGTTLAANLITVGSYYVCIYSLSGNNFRLSLGLTQAVADTRYAALAGLSTQIFRNANAVGPNDSVALGQFVASLAANGYEKLPNGLIIQWEQFGAIAIGGTLVVTFPISFPNAALNVIATPNGNAQGTIEVYSAPTLTGVTLGEGGGVKAITAGYLIAIGY